MSCWLRLNFERNRWASGPACRRLRWRYRRNHHHRCRNIGFVVPGIRLVGQTTRRRPGRGSRRWLHLWMCRHRLDRHHRRCPLAHRRIRRHRCQTIVCCPQAKDHCYRWPHRRRRQHSRRCPTMRFQRWRCKHRVGSRWRCHRIHLHRCRSTGLVLQGKHRSHRRFHHRLHPRNQNGRRWKFLHS